MCEINVGTGIATEIENAVLSKMNEGLSFTGRDIYEFMKHMHNETAVLTYTSQAISSFVRRMYNKQYYPFAESNYGSMPVKHKGVGPLLYFCVSKKVRKTAKSIKKELKIKKELEDNFKKELKIKKELEDNFPG